MLENGESHYYTVHKGKKTYYNKNGYITDKKGNVLPPPPPPPAPVKKGNGPNGSTYYPIPPPIPEDATPEQRAKMQAAIDDFEKTYKRKVHQAKSESGELYSIIANDDVYDPSQNENDIKTGFIKIYGTPHYFVTINDFTKYYNRQGFEVNKSGKTISANQVNASDIIPGQYITKVHSDGQIVSEFKDNKPSREATLVDIPPPPAPISTLDFIIDLAKKNAKFYYENETISSDKAIELLKQNPYLNILAKDTKKKQPQVFISVEPISSKQTKVKKTKSLENNCLTVPNLNIRLKNKTLIIPCIKDYPNNKLEIFDRWGKLIYSKSGYDNSWKGEKENGKFIKAGTYYYAIKTGTKEKDKTGYFQISDNLVGVLATNELAVMVNGKTPVNGQLSLSKKELKDLKLSMKKLEIKTFKLKIKGKRTQLNSGNSLNEKAKSYTDNVSEGNTIQLFDIKASNGLKLKPIIILITK